ncbi:MAG: hypothetical protein ABR985_14615 [Methanotrichaceae archaeon]|jgi:hypothetical protein
MKNKDLHNGGASNHAASTGIARETGNQSGLVITQLAGAFVGLSNNALKAPQALRRLREAEDIGIIVAAEGSIQILPVQGHEVV